MSHVANNIPSAAARPDPAVPVCQRLLQDHRDTEALLDELQAALRGGEADGRREAARLLAQLIPEMDTHFACEEQGLFPELSRYHPMVLMEVEHDDLLGLRARLSEAIGSEEDPIRLFELATEFCEYLRNHIVREDVGIFPMAERDLAPEEKERAWERMEAIRHEAKTTPTPPITRPARTFRPFSLNGPEGEAAAGQDVFIRTLINLPDYQLKVLRLKAGASIPAHWSPRRITLLLWSGEAACECGDAGCRQLKPGDGLVLDP